MFYFKIVGLCVNAFQKESCLIRKGKLCLQAWRSGDSFDKAADVREWRRATEAWRGRAIAVGKMECVWLGTGTNSEAVPISSVPHWSFFFMSHCLNTHYFQLISSVLTEISSVYFGAVQWNFLQWWQCSVSMLFSMVASSCKWLLSTRNGTSVTEELNFY